MGGDNSPRRICFGRDRGFCGPHISKFTNAMQILRSQEPFDILANHNKMRYMAESEVLLRMTDQKPSYALYQAAAELVSRLVARRPQRRVKGWRSARPFNMRVGTVEIRQSPFL